MKLRLLMATTIAAVAFSSANAKTSSDYGSYYGKVNLGYAMTNYSASNQTTKFKGKGFVGAVDFGYNLSNNLRTELEFYLDNGVPGKKSGIKIDSKTYGALVNFAYDFKNSSKFTPFVMAGVGYAKNKFAVSVPATTTQAAYTAKESKNRFIYQVGAGVAFEVEKNISLELGYRAIHKGIKSVTATKVTGTPTFKRKGSFEHVALVGVRVNF